MIRPPERRVPGWRLAALACALLLAGCREGVDLGDLIAPTGAFIRPSFAADAPPPGPADHLVTLRQGRVRQDRILVEVTVSGVLEPISGVALKVTYPASIAAFVECDDGNLFQPGACLASEQPPGSGQVIVARSITAPETPIPSTGTHVAVSLVFRMTGEGSGPIVFEAKNLSGGDATAVLDAAGIPLSMTWVEGTLSGESRR